ncbi:MAG: TetR family transcriptional regulator [bacterium]|nr:TetR family transcriptional regulator [bacterium]
MSKTDKRDEIINAALELIAEHGFHGTSMAMIADRAKVGAGTIYRYFDSKDVLIIELFKVVEAKLHATLDVTSESEHSIQDRFLHLGKSMLKYLIDNPTHYKYLEQFFNSPYGVEQRRIKLLGEKGKENAILRIFTDGVEQGEMKDLPVVALCALSFGPIMTMARDHILGFFTLDDELITQTIDSCWSGIKK